MKKRLFALTLAGTMMVSTLSGCGGTSGNSSNAGSSSAGSSNAGSDGKLKVAVSMAVRDQFLSTLEEATIAAAKDAGVQLATFDANNDVAAQISHVQTCAANGYNAMIVNLVNTDSAQELVNLAGDMKLIFVNRMPADKSVLNENVVYVGSDEKEAGRMQGEFIANYLKEQGKTEANGIMIMGVLGLDNTNSRTSAAKKALEDSGIKVNWIWEDTAEWDRSKAMDKMTQVLGDSSKKFDFVIANADDMALGAIEAMKTTLGEVPVPVCGIDGGTTGCHAVKEGSLTFTVFQNAVGQGSNAIDCAVRMCNGDDMSDLDSYIKWVPFEPITIENVDDYYQG